MTSKKGLVNHWYGDEAYLPIYRVAITPAVAIVVPRDVETRPIDHLFITRQPLISFVLYIRETVYKPHEWGCEDFHCGG